MADDGNLGGSRVKGATISGDLKTDSPAYMACMGWFTGLCRELEPMPNSDLHEIDHIEFKDLFAECKMDLAAGGCAPENMPNLTLWRKVWKAEFPNLRRRLFKSVDSKDKVRAELRRLLRKKSLLQWGRSCLLDWSSSGVSWLHSTRTVPLLGGPFESC